MYPTKISNLGAKFGIFGLILNESYDIVGRKIDYSIVIKQFPVLGVT